MATALPIAAQTTPNAPLKQHLQTTHLPDRDCVDGELKERNVGRREQARIQALQAGWFIAGEKDWQILVATKQRVQVSATRVRVLDVADDLAEQPDVLTDSPHLTGEILSPADTYTDLELLAADFRKMGVGTISIIDPPKCTAQIFRGARRGETTRFEVPGTPIGVELSDLLPYLTAYNG